MPVRRVRLTGPFDLVRTLAPLHRGPGDRTFRIAGGRILRATRTADGPASVAIGQVDQRDVLKVGPQQPPRFYAIAPRRSGFNRLGNPESPSTNPNSRLGA